ncbi:MAG: Fe-S cluster assembly protein SufD [Rikenellaceae bacterium]|nr:Fe-S cluster assembly protein SufD [Rikenellaceae bacterium]
MRTIEQKLADLYFANLDLLEEGLPAAVNRHRSDAIQNFHLMGLPSQKNEKYKYTDIRSRYAADYEKFFTPFGAWDDSWQPLVGEAFTVRLLNGYVYGEERLIALENGILYGSLRTAAERCPELVEEYYNRLAGKGSDAVSSLNTAFTQDGLFVYLPRHTAAGKPVVVIQGCRSEESAQVYHRALIIAEENAQVQVVFQSTDADETPFLINSLTEVFAGQGARIEIVDVISENNRSTHLSNQYVRQEKDSWVQTVSVHAEGGVIRTDTSTYLEGKGAENHMHGLFMAGEGEHLDSHTNIEHRAADCISYEDFRGVASGDGVGVFNGRILVAQDAQRTQAFQENHNLLLNDDAAIHTKPQLEIYADDVKCSHGATVGQLDEQAVFYMRQRGIGQQEARKLQLYGFVRTIIDKITLRKVAEAVDGLVTAKIDRL